MIAKMYDERRRKWILIDDVKVVDSFISRYKLVDGTGRPIKAEEQPSQNPAPKDWNPNILYLDRLLIKFDEERNEKTATFKAVGLYVPQNDGTEKYYCYGFTAGFLVNGDGKTIERL